MKNEMYLTSVFDKPLLCTYFVLFTWSCCNTNPTIISKSSASPLTANCSDNRNAIAFLLLGLSQKN